MVERTSPSRAAAAGSNPLQRQRTLYRRPWLRYRALLLRHSRQPRNAWDARVLENATLATPYGRKIKAVLDDTGANVPFDVAQIEDLNEALPRRLGELRLIDLIDDRRFAETIYRVALADGIMDRVTDQPTPRVHHAAGGAAVAWPVLAPAADPPITQNTAANLPHIETVRVKPLEPAATSYQFRLGDLADGDASDSVEVGQAGIAVGECGVSVSCGLELCAADKE